eukprot:CAMPEP_0114553998 /NCGR_PEP_ID=MMETSP0114-20121206/7972_1 /TAXON_ID=31324 /ORGANISM="Goniomonas sp, Strain m" /LENGTH=437 /DNA_ID=CAMNT_0001739009 /DNA_START=45 /DNA_END=1358 /DNA_ORIENTATION=+
MKRKTAKPVQTETESETESEVPVFEETIKRTSSSGSKNRDPPRTPMTAKEKEASLGQKFGAHTDFKTRASWSLVMMFGFIFIVMLGHFYVIGLVFFLNVMIFKEILELKRRREKEHNLKYFRVINWSFFLVTCYYLYGRWLSSRLQTVSMSYPWIEMFTNYHAFKSFLAYCLGFLAFVASLQKHFYRYQFGQFAWTHMTLLFVVCQSSVMIVNIFDGIIWFFLSAGLVICNDIWAYIWGRAFGRTPLIALSPKKTWEGFIGALLTTIVLGVVMTWILSLFPEMTCSQDTITLVPFAQPSCAPTYPFTPTVFALPPWAAQIYGQPTVTFKPILLHSLALSVFASLIAPFGGFFASGFKRAFKIKDFGDTIPGHGGITDRMDCQILMSLFVYIYRTTFVKARLAVTVSAVLGQVATLSSEEQLNLYRTLTTALKDKGLI